MSLAALSELAAAAALQASGPTAWAARPASRRAWASSLAVGLACHRRRRSRTGCGILLNRYRVYLLERSVGLGRFPNQERNCSVLLGRGGP